MDPEDNPTILLLILDLHPISWSISANPSPSAASNDALKLSDALNQVLVFLNAHLANRWGNELVVYAALEGGKSELLFSSNGPSPSLSHSIPPNSFEPFHSMNATVRARLKEVMVKQEEEDTRPMDQMDLDASEGLDAGGVNGKPKEKKGGVDSITSSGPAIVPALLKALCHINRLHSTTASGNTISNLQSSTTGHHLSEITDGSTSGIKARIMVINNTAERGAGSGGYVGLMNGVFAAQKRKTPIDVLNLASSDSIFLQQASHLTNGIYFRAPSRSNLLLHLSMIFLPSPVLRSQLGLPSQDRVDFRAVCFCHHRVVDIGFVCSVCLSIFCSPVPICATCKSRFPLATIQQLKKCLPATPTNGAATPPGLSAIDRLNGVSVPSPLAVNGA